MHKSRSIRIGSAFTTGWMRHLFALAVLLALAWPCEVAAKTQTIQFAPGGTHAEIQGGIARGETITYLLTAREGQTMRVQATSAENNAVFQIRAPGPRQSFLPGAADGDDASSWQGVLPHSGTYKIILGATRGGADYSLCVEIRR